MDLPLSTAVMLGRVSRRYRYSGRPLDLLGRASGRAARNVARRVSATELPYLDINGYRRFADVNDHMELEGFLGVRRLENEVARLIQPGDWVIDVGANVGLITSQLARLVGPSGRVWAIEPIPRNFRRLHQLADENDLAQLRIFDGALSNVAGEATIRLPADRQSGWASFTKSWDMDGTVTTRTWRLDDLIRGESGRISFIKLDVEGFEPQVLMGAHQVLTTMRPYVMCEFNDILLRDAGSSSAELLKTFSDLGYVPTAEDQPALSQLEGHVVDLLLEPVPTALPSVEPSPVLEPATTT